MCLPSRGSRSRRGVITVLAVFLMTMTLAMVAFSVGMANLCWVDTQTQATADAAALAGARGLTVSQSQVQSLAIAAAKLNTCNGQSVVLQDSNIATGVWAPSTRTFTATTTSPNACKVTVPLTAAGSNAVKLMFGSVVGDTGANVSSTAIAGAGRWDIVLCCDRTSSFSEDLSQATAGMHAVLSDLNAYTPLSNLGVVTFNGVAYTNASLQAVGTNYSTLNTAINNIVDCSSGGPPCSGSDLAAGMAGAIALFSASGYSPPVGTRQAVIFISDGAANMGSGCLNKSLSDTQDNTLAATEASNAWTNKGISVYSLLYFHGSDSTTDTNAMQALAQGTGNFVQEPSAAQLTTDIQSMLMNNLSMQLVQ
ncbi:MAG: vWA domain-containing protein [Isosphaeraceae bacterium]